MNYREALDYILGFANYERLPRSAFVFDLRRMEQLLARLGNPHNAVRSVHIAGTKGKGSTSAMIASVLNQSGYRTGLYTSPHLLSLTERIQLNGRPVPEDAFAGLTEALKPEVEAVNRLAAFGELTTFEILTALAFVHFKAAGADYQVLEVGLGGRLDATNVIATPQVCVITSISFDHMDVLGNTLTGIATEKAGIIKPGAAVVCAPQSPEAMAVIEKVCRQRAAKLVVIGSDITWDRKELGPEAQSFTLSGLKGKYDLSIPLIGEHQLENAAAAVATAEILSGLGADRISPETIAAGLGRVRWPGRLQVLRRGPWVVIDGAHNADSARRLREALPLYFNFDRALLIVGIASDKDIAGIVAALAPLTGRVIVTRSRHPRSAAPAALAGEFSKRGIVPEVAENVTSAVDLALARATPGDLVCVTGSIFVIAEVMEYLRSPA